MSNFILVDKHGRSQPIDDPGQLQAQIAMAAMNAPRHTMTRADGSTSEFVDVQSWALGQLKPRLRQAWCSVTNQRADAFDATLGAAGNQDLTQRLPEILREPLPPMSLRRDFFLDTSVQAGALFYKQTRRNYTGEAQYTRSGRTTGVTEVQLGQTDLIKPMRYLVTKASVDFFSQMSMNYMGVDELGEKVRAMRQILERRINDDGYSGVESLDLDGVLNHQFLDRAVSAQTMSRATDADDMAEAISEASSYAYVNSDTVFESNAAQVSPDIMRIWTSKRIGDGSDTLFEYIKKANPQITKWTVARELKGVGDSGESGVLFYRQGREGVRIMTSLPPTLIPPVNMGLHSEVYMVAGFGGCNIPEVGNCYLVLFPVA